MNASSTVVRAKVLILLVLLAGSALATSADTHSPDVPYENIDYNGRFTFVRVRFEPTFWSLGNHFWGLDLKWNHDYPRGDLHFSKMVSELTYLDVNVDQTNILSLADPELFKYPWAYLCEVGFWNPTEEEVKNLREYLLKGGFLVIDDFFWGHWMNFEAQMRRVFRDAQLMEVDESHPIFDSFFHTQPLSYINPNYPEIQPAYYGIFEDNDPNKRLMVIVNYNSDIGEFWEWSDTGWVPIDLSNEAYKLGVDYVIYGMTH